MTSDREWSRLWIRALNNMPWMAECIIYRQILLDNVWIKTGYVHSKYQRGNATALRMCMGYNVYSSTGRSNAVATNYNAIQRGSKPRGYARQNMLKALAGPHGATIARARLIQLNQASRFKYWPQGA